MSHAYAFRQNVPDYDPEHSEVMIYHVRVLEEMGEYREALALLDANAKDRVIVDRVAIMETRGVSYLLGIMATKC